MRITHKIAEKAGEDIKQKFLSKCGTMADAYERMPGDLSVAISCKWKPSDDQETICADIGIAFKVDECREKETYKYTDGKFGPLFDRKKMTGLKKILFRDFGDLGRKLEESSRKRKWETAVKEGLEKALPQTATDAKTSEEAQGQEKESDPSQAPCIGCEYHKGMPNPKKGIRIPGVPGKCIREGGHCFRGKEWLETQGNSPKSKPKAKPKAKPKVKPQAKQKAKKGLDYDVE
jgi:hypothetical protein